MYCTEVDELRSEFLDVFGPLYERADEEVTPMAELFYVVDVGTPSETETRQLYRNAATDVFVITNSFAYLDDVESDVASALERGVDISILFLDPSELPDEKAAFRRISSIESHPSISQSTIGSAKRCYPGEGRSSIRI